MRWTRRLKTTWRQRSVWHCLYEFMCGWDDQQRVWENSLRTTRMRSFVFAGWMLTTTTTRLQEWNYFCRCNFCIDANSAWKKYTKNIADKSFFKYGKEINTRRRIYTEHRSILFGKVVDCWLIHRMLTIVNFRAKRQLSDLKEKINTRKAHRTRAQCERTRSRSSRYCETCSKQNTVVEQRSHTAARSMCSSRAIERAPLPTKFTAIFRVPLTLYEACTIYWYVCVWMCVWFVCICGTPTTKRAASPNRLTE